MVIQLQFIFIWQGYPLESSQILRIRCTSSLEVASLTTSMGFLPQKFSHFVINKENLFLKFFQKWMENERLST